MQKNLKVKFVWLRVIEKLRNYGFYDVLFEIQ